MAAKPTQGITARKRRLLVVVSMAKGKKVQRVSVGFRSKRIGSLAG